MNLKKSFIVLGLSILISGGARALPVLDQSATASNNIHSVSDFFTVAQTFTAGITGELARAELSLLNFALGGVENDLILDVVTTSAGAPTTTILGSSSITAASLPPFTTTTAVFNFASGLNLIASELYALRLSSPGTTSEYGWLFSAQSGSGGGSDPDFYTAGQMYRDNGSGLNPFLGDTVFATFMEEASAVPAPGPLGILLFGLTALGVRGYFSGSARK